MAYSSPLGQSHAHALTTSQSAARTFRSSAIWNSISFFGNAESTEQWRDCENALLSCLRTGDDKSAFVYLEKLTARFGASNERVMALRGLYQEAVAEDDLALHKVLSEYEALLLEEPANFPIAKRRISLLRTLGRPSEAIACLTTLLQASPTDVEAWCELADLYFAQGLVLQAAFCLEEVLLIVPNAWTIHARLGDIWFTAAKSNVDDKVQLVHALQCYCRSTELCVGYLRGFYGIKLVSARLLRILPPDRGLSSIDTHRNAVVDLNDIRSLDKRATEELSKIVQKKHSGLYDLKEIEAVESLIANSPKHD